MAGPFGKREMIAWTIAGALAVVAAVAYATRPKPVPIPPLPVSEIKSPLTAPVKFDTLREKLVFVKGDSAVKSQGSGSRDSLGAPVMSAPLTKRNPR